MAGKGKKKLSKKSNKKVSNTKNKSTVRKNGNKKTPSNKDIRKIKAEEEKVGFIEENKTELIFILISVFSVLLLLSNFHLVGPLGEIFNKILFGSIGVFSWIFPIYVFMALVLLLAKAGNRRIRNKVLATAGIFISLGGIF